MRTLALIMIIGLSVYQGKAQKFSEYFIDKTLRVDYIFTGNAGHQSIYLDGLSSLPSWAGRKHHLSEIPLEGNGQIRVKDLNSQECIYKTSFSSLFQEWLSTDEAHTASKAFENTFLLPYPIQPIEIEVVLFDMNRKEVANLKHIVKPDDILIHQKGTTHITPHKYLIQNGSSDQTIDVVILAEGYTEEEMAVFHKDAQIACESIFNHEPFQSMKDKFNVIAVASPSIDSGVSIPHQQLWKNTAFSSHFDTFYSERYLTTSRVKSIHDALAGIPYEHIIILANTEQYGGGGIYNAFTLTTAHHPMFRPVVVHEFGHSFGGLGDEYFYDQDIMSDMYPLHIEPWEQNITMLVSFETKWKDMLKKGTPHPTPPAEKDKYPVGVYEGGGYAAKGIYRPADNCRMRTNEYPAFCPVCQRAITRIINFYTE
ncbi:peptidase M64 [Bacteroides sp. 51]|nr:IgA Peptidase M64 [Bacteroides sp. 51]NDV82428.1 peptidase M64 [Bacteroides sp. 51]